MLQAPDGGTIVQRHLGSVHVADKYTRLAANIGSAAGMGDLERAKELKKEFDDEWAKDPDSPKNAPAATDKPK